MNLFPLILFSIGIFSFTAFSNPVPEAQWGAIVGAGARAGARAGKPAGKAGAKVGKEVGKNGIHNGRPPSELGKTNDPDVIKLENSKKCKDMMAQKKKTANSPMQMSRGGSLLSMNVDAQTAIACGHDGAHGYGDQFGKRGFWVLDRY